jgi:hypothetical protein
VQNRALASTYWRADGGYFIASSFPCFFAFLLLRIDLHTVQSASILQKLAFGVGQLGFEIDLLRAPTIHYLLLYLKLDFRKIYI